MITTLSFKKYTSADFLDYHNLVKEDEVMQYITGKGMSEVDAKKRFSFILALGHQNDSIGYFQVLEAANRTILGDCKLVYNKNDSNVFEIGYLLKKEYWKMGLGTKICEYLLCQASIIDQKKDVIGVIDPKNIASRRLLEKFGFKSYFIGQENSCTIEKLILKRN